MGTKNAGLKIIGVLKGSLAHRKGITEGDIITNINGYPIRDLIDYLFSSSEEHLEIELLSRDLVSRKIKIENRNGYSLGVEVEDIKARRCQNNCLFCFMNQNPKGMRSSLYCYDDDYRLSFLYGNYITLTNLSGEDLERIVEQRLSPLYISVHTTDPETRIKILNNRKANKLIEQIRFLTEGGIEIHAQIVLCPGINDGSQLRQSLSDLSQFYPSLRSVAIVPVGLTKFRSGLLFLKTVDVGYARGLVEQLESFQEKFLGKLGSRFAFLADEFYIKGGVEIPSGEHYEGYLQLEDGIGMARVFLDNFGRRLKDIPDELSSPRDVTLITGALASGIIENCLRKMGHIKNLRTKLAVVENKFFGEGVSVSGLLTGIDILDSLEKNAFGGTVILPSNALKDGYLFLDDLTIKDLEGRLGTKVDLASSEGEDFIDRVIGI